MSATCTISGLNIDHDRKEAVIIPIEAVSTFHRPVHNSDSWVPLTWPIQAIFNTVDNNLKIIETHNASDALDLVTTTMLPWQKGGLKSPFHNTLSWEEFLEYTNIIPWDGGHISWCAIDKGVYNALSDGYLPSPYHDFPSKIDISKTAKEITSFFRLKSSSFGKDAVNLAYFSIQEYGDWIKIHDDFYHFESLAFPRGRRQDCRMLNNSMKQVIQMIEKGIDPVSFLENLVRFGIFCTNMSILHKPWIPSMYKSQEQNLEAVLHANKLLSAALK